MITIKNKKSKSYKNFLKKRNRNFSGYRINNTARKNLFKMYKRAGHRLFEKILTELSRNNLDRHSKSYIINLAEKLFQLGLLVGSNGGDVNDWNKEYSNINKGLKNDSN